MITIQFAVIFFVVSIGLFFALRSLNIWYLKINVILKNQEIQKEMLRKLLEVNNIKSDFAPITQNTTQKPPVQNYYLNNLVCEDIQDSDSSVVNENIKASEDSSQKTAIILSVIFVILIVLYVFIIDSIIWFYEIIYI